MLFLYVVISCQAETASLRFFLMFVRSSGKSLERASGWAWGRSSMDLIWRQFLKGSVFFLSVGLPGIPMFCNSSAALARFIDGFQYPRVLEKYDVVGRVLLVSLALGAAYNASDAAMPLKMLLGQKPPEDIMTLDKIAAYHDMRDYLQIAQKLSDSDHR